MLTMLVSWTASAQHFYDYAPPPKEFDWQLFEPFNLDCLTGPQQSTGYFFSARRMHMWLLSPNRAPLGNVATPIPGNPDAYVLSNVDHIYQVYAAGFDTIFGVAFAAEDQTSMLATGVIGGAYSHQFNSIDDSNPNTTSGWGNRIEFGWVSDGGSRHHGDQTGWMISILDGIGMNDSYRVGFDDKRLAQLGAAQGLDGVDGDSDGGGIDANGNAVPTQPTAPVQGFQAIPAVDGLLTTHVNFRDPLGLLLTFVEAPEGTAGIGTTFGTILDINNNGIIDAGDRVPTAVVYDQIEVENSTEVSGVELMAIRRKKRLHGGGTAEFFFGARYFEFDDRFFVDAKGGILADTIFTNNAVNRIVGPQFGIRIAKQTGRWSAVFNGRFMSGANFNSINLNGTIGDHLTTGFLVGGVGPDGFGGADFRNSFRDERFTPLGELRYDASFSFTRAIKLNVGWQGIAAGGLARASNTVDYVLPTLGILDKHEEIFSHAVTFGFEINR